MADKNVLYLDKLTNMDDFLSLNIADASGVDSFEEYLLKIDSLETSLPKRRVQEEQGFFPTLFRSEEAQKYRTVSGKRELYRPKKVRNKGSQREGYCEECGKWFKLKTSSYWYHMNYKHGINSDGLKYPEPSVQFNKNKIESYCAVCKKWIYLGYQKSSKSYNFNWYRHWQRGHKTTE